MFLSIHFSSIQYIHFVQTSPPPSPGRSHPPKLKLGPHWTTPHFPLLRPLGRPPVYFLSSRIWPLWGPSLSVVTQYLSIYICLFPWVQHLQGSAMLQHVSEFPSFLSLNNIVINLCVEPCHRTAGLHAHKPGPASCTLFDPILEYSPVFIYMWGYPRTKLWAP